MCRIEMKRCRFGVQNGVYTICKTEYVGIVLYINDHQIVLLSLVSRLK